MTFDDEYLRAALAPLRLGSLVHGVQCSTQSCFSGVQMNTDCGAQTIAPTRPPTFKYIEIKHGFYFLGIAWLSAIRATNNHF